MPRRMAIRGAKARSFSTDAWEPGLRSGWAAPPGARRAWTLLVAADRVLLDLLVQRRRRDAERTRSLGLVAVVLLERLLDRSLLDRLQRAAGQRQLVDRGVAPPRPEEQEVARK